MKKYALMIVLLLILVVGAAPVAAITWGQPDSDHPNVGAMVVDWPGYGPFQVCTGTLIHPRIFLTAGHCTVDWEGTGVETFWVNFDQDALNPSTMLDIEEIIPHPEYYWGPTSDPHDVGILVLEESVIAITPATLPAEGFLDDLAEQGLLGHGRTRATFTLVGYGGILDWPPPVITYEDQRLSSESEFRALLKTWLRMSQNQATGDGGTCYGDSGGPAFWNQPDGEEVLVGITSWGDAPCVASAFNYRVDIPQTLDFIADVIAGLD